ncbi:unnamed protein product [Cochlearia groenlandica]
MGTVEIISTTISPLTEEIDGVGSIAAKGACVSLQWRVKSQPPMLLKPPEPESLPPSLHQKPETPFQKYLSFLS